MGCTALALINAGSTGLHASAVSSSLLGKRTSITPATTSSTVFAATPRGFHRRQFLRTCALRNAVA
jgi:hypothetical protein